MNYILFTSGCYSDFGVSCLVARNAPVDRGELQSKWKEAIKVSEQNRDTINTIVEKWLTNNKLPRYLTNVWAGTYRFDSQDYWNKFIATKGELKLETDIDDIFYDLIKTLGYTEIEFLEENIDDILDS